MASGQMAGGFNIMIVGPKIIIDVAAGFFCWTLRTQAAHARWLQRASLHARVGNPEAAISVVQRSGAWPLS